MIQHVVENQSKLHYLFGSVQKELKEWLVMPQEFNLRSRPKERSI